MIRKILVFIIGILFVATATAQIPFTSIDTSKSSKRVINGIRQIFIDGSSDEIQLLIQGNSTQTANLVVFENSAGTDQFVLTNTGNATITGSLTVNGTGTSMASFGAASSGASNRLSITNLDNTSAASNALLRITVGGLSAGDPYIYFDYGADWSIGVDQSDSGAFVLSRFSSLGTSNRLRVTTGGLVGINANATSQLHVTSGAAGTVGLIVNTAGSPTVNVFELQNNGRLQVRSEISSSRTDVILLSEDFGNNVAGARLETGRNTSAGTESGAAGTVLYREADNGASYTWADTTSVLRINSTAPTGSAGTPTVADTAGTVVGSQTSYWRLKSNISVAEQADYEMALQAVLDTDLYNFNTIGDHERKRRFGYVIYENDKGSWFSYNDLTLGAVPALDERNLFGYHAGAIKALHAKIKTLEEALARLR